MRVLVTGASGILGRGVAQALADRGDQSDGATAAPGRTGVPEVLADISDLDAVRAAVSDQDGHSPGRQGKRDRAGGGYRRVNVQGTRAVVNSCVTAGVPRLVYVSSPSVAHARNFAGRPRRRRSADPLSRGRYARSKAAAERIALSADHDQLAVVAVRPHLVWGPGDNWWPE